jgi:hypothetical protein
MYNFSGIWKSVLYPNLSGSLSIELPYNYIDLFNTNLKINYNNKLLNFSLQGIYDKDNDDFSRYLLIPNTIELQQSFLITLTHNCSPILLDGFYTCIYPYDIGTISIKCNITCYGCLNNNENQLAHMDYGGCLYNPDFL